MQGIAILLVGEALLLGMVFLALRRWCPTFRGAGPGRRADVSRGPGDRGSRADAHSLEDHSLEDHSLEDHSLEDHSSSPNAETCAQRLLASEPELASLYERLGFSLEFEREGQALLTEIKSTLEVAIPDLEAFRAALTSARERIRGAALQRDDPLAQALAARARDPLLLAVEEAGEDRERLVQILGRDPVDQLLPVVEQMPFLRDGRVVWRTPMGLDLLQKKAAHGRRFVRILERLESWVRSAKIRRGEEAKAAVLEASARLRTTVEQGGTYLVTPVKTLEERYADWYLQRRDPSFMARRRGLDGILLDLARGPVAGTAGGLAERDRRAATVARYCQQAWMQSPRLAALLLAFLLEAEVGRFPGLEPGLYPGLDPGVKAEGADSLQSKPWPSKPWPGDRPGDPRVLLHAVRDEVATGRFDVDETVRRLRQLESAGLAVHSLAFKLLRDIGAGQQARDIPAGNTGPRRAPSALSA